MGTADLVVWYHAFPVYRQLMATVSSRILSLVLFENYIRIQILERQTRQNLGKCNRKSCGKLTEYVSNRLLNASRCLNAMVILLQYQKKL